MIFPLPSIWFDSPVVDNVALRVDRFEDAKRHRMAVGLHLNEDFSAVYGSLLIVSGHGKYLSSCSWFADQLNLPNGLQERLEEISTTHSPELINLSSIKSELALFQSQLVVRLKEKAGKYVDRILAICVTDPGLWQADFDGRPIYHSLCDATKLAELTGLNVIDSFPARDIAHEGSGKNLEALPLWLMLADRDYRKATSSRLAILVDATCQAVFLPGSDGLDSELPWLRTLPLCGESFFRALANRAGDFENEKLLEMVTLNGKQSEPLLNAWRQIDFSQDQASAIEFDQLNEQTRTVELVDALRSCIVLSANQLLDWMQCLDSKLPVDQISVCGGSVFSTLLVNELSNRLADSPSRTQVIAGPATCETRATLAAMLGFLTIDQMPASLPWLTGSANPQVLGQITAGRPSNWRQLLIEMADYRPPVMKLKDAV